MCTRTQKPRNLFLRKQRSETETMSSTQLISDIYTSSNYRDTHYLLLCFVQKTFLVEKIPDLLAVCHKILLTSFLKMGYYNYNNILHLHLFCFAVLESSTNCLNMDIFLSFLYNILVFRVSNGIGKSAIE